MNVMGISMIGLKHWRQQDALYGMDLSQQVYVISIFVWTTKQTLAYHLHQYRFCSSKLYNEIMTGLILMDKKFQYYKKSISNPLFQNNVVQYYKLQYKATLQCIVFLGHHIPPITRKNQGLGLNLALARVAHHSFCLLDCCFLA